MAALESRWRRSSGGSSLSAFLGESSWSADWVLGGVGGEPPWPGARQWWLAADRGWGQDEQSSAATKSRERPRGAPTAAAPEG
ncbi:hypothetical protein E2562_000232 [Oryza meyeriana var. granulata]|uniref:Uncharacterized protein n=1 Tax=Oryza meyeriana var. granulata TaxID=110450 RepID=A0A6G1CLN1_9ORYZ|nr:hypothetical protein E2562_000232 [Oryza meyeriana var. granulata]